MLAWGQSFEMLFFARILDGITGGNIIVAQAYITDITPREKRTESLGYIFAAFGLGFIFGPALGGGLAAAFGIRTPFLMAAVAALVVVWLTWVTLDETLSPEQRQASRNTSKGSLNLKQIFRNKILLIVLIIAFFGQFAFGLLQSTFALYSEAVLFSGYTLKQTNLGIGLLLSFIGITQVLTQSLLLRPAVKRYGEAKLVLIGHLSRTLGFFILAAITSPWPAISSMIFFALGIGLMMPSLQSIATTTAPDELRGEVLGIYQSTINLATIFGTALAGFIFSISPPMPYWLAGGLSLLVTLPILALVRQVPHRADEREKGVKVKRGA
jgi:DHA1 family tetracycline resistance protein-like MFS transporter